MDVWTMPELTLTLLPGRFAVCRLDARAAVPAWAFTEGFCSVTRTTEELSIVCREEAVPGEVRCRQGWVCLKVEGPLDFSLTGVMASLAGPLAEAEISLFSLATYDTDYLLIDAGEFEKAKEALTRAGHTVQA
jgi:hypothetical protein